MDFSHYNDGSVQLTVDFVNTEDDEAGSLASVDDFTHFLSAHGAEWHDWNWWQQLTPEDSDLRDARRLRKRLRNVWDVGNTEDATAIINDLLTAAGTRPRVSLHNKPHLHFDPQKPTIAHWIGSTAAMALATVIVQFGYERLGICDSSTCNDVFVDTSRNQSRRHCSTTCTTRENVAAHRARTKSD